LPQPELSDAEWATVECFSRLLRLAAGQLWLAFQEAGEVDFIEIAARAGLALGDDEAPTDLAQALDYRIRHLLVDEFQDTSPSQVGLLEKLTRGWMPDDGRTLFVVGDPMQSIYRFRKADVGLFLRVRERGIGDIRLQHLRLFRNNRSYPGIVDWVNAAFPGIFPAEDCPEAGAVRYAESAATRPARGDSAVVVHPVIEREGSDSAGEEARRVLEIIRRPAARRRTSASPCWSAPAAISMRWSPKSAAAPRTCASRRSISKGWMAASMCRICSPCSAPCITAPTACIGWRCCAHRGAA
jgi:ATP-dependent helicase/nuclease subunit A